ncbi:hypothetical protein FHR32_002640 [Streptosporangium album]|uniref:Uncharacterized protein n=1 Tax=Streptosporangium album TaxID=47479 RepID=A0A7W7RUC2_9ACTN|nr:hypothetical protein [Streptosporangium album]MBB4938335.1 hypothetical protein [Streptosporangium album]
MADQAKRIRLDIPSGPEYDQVRDMHGHTVTVFESTEVNGRRSLKIGSRTLVLQRVGVDESGNETTEIFRAQSISEPSY